MTAPIIAVVIAMVEAMILPLMSIAEERFRPIAVIELFTSQGCSSCPPADRLLSETLAEAASSKTNVYALSFHVDYWNHLGWVDPFSDKRYSQRQNTYAAAFGLNSVYTPQAVVNGKDECVGSDAEELKSAIAKSLNMPSTAAFKKLYVVWQKDGGVVIQYALQGMFSGSAVHFALVSLSERTQIRRGENAGRSLASEHVVRQFISVDATGDGSISFDPSPVLAKAHCAVIAYIQRSDDLVITGAAMAEIE